MNAESVSQETFKAEVLEWADRIGVAPTQIHVRQMKRKWGSCSTSGRVTFSADLLGQPPTTRNEVIVHELLHLKMPSHGKLFRNMERAYLSKHATQ